MSKKQKAKTPADSDARANSHFSYFRGPQFFADHPAGFVYPSLPARASYNYAAKPSTRKGDKILSCACVTVAEDLKSSTECATCDLREIPKGGMFRVLEEDDVADLPNGIWLKLSRRKFLAVSIFDTEVPTRLGFGQVLKCRGGFLVSPVDYSVLVHSLSYRESSYEAGADSSSEAPAAQDACDCAGCPQGACTCTKTKPGEESEDAHAKNAAEFFGLSSQETKTVRILSEEEVAQSGADAVQDALDDKGLAEDERRAALDSVRSAIDDLESRLMDLHDLLDGVQVDVGLFGCISELQVRLEQLSEPIMPVSKVAVLDSEPEKKSNVKKVASKTAKKSRAKKATIVR